MTEIEDKLRAKIERQARELKHLNEGARVRNLELDALHYVWCNGGCKSGTHRWTEKNITKELVETAIRNTNRLISWYNNSEFKKLDHITVKPNDVWFYFRIAHPRKLYHRILKWFAMKVEY